MAFVRKVDPLGRVVLPADWRRAQGIEFGDYVSLTAEEGRLVVSKVELQCYFCRGELAYPAKKFQGKYICEKCLKELKNL